MTLTHTLDIYPKAVESKFNKNPCMHKLISLLFLSWFEFLVQLFPVLFWSYVSCFVFQFLPLSLSGLSSFSPVFHLLIRPWLHKPVFLSFSLSVRLLLSCVSCVPVLYPIVSPASSMFLLFPALLFVFVILGLLNSWICLLCLVLLPPFSCNKTKTKNWISLVFFYSSLSPIKATKSLNVIFMYFYCK